MESILLAHYCWTKLVSLNDKIGSGQCVEELEDGANAGRIAQPHF